MNYNTYYISPSCGLNTPTEIFHHQRCVFKIFPLNHREELDILKSFFSKITSPCLVFVENNYGFGHLSITEMLSKDFPHLNITIGKIPYDAYSPEVIAEIENHNHKQYQRKT